MKNAPKVNFDYEVEGIQMTLTTWQDLQQHRGTALFTEIEELARGQIAKSKYFKVYDQNSEFAVYSLCTNKEQLDELFEPAAFKAESETSEAT